MPTQPICLACKKPYTRTGNRQLYCPECQATACTSCKNVVGHAPMCARSRQAPTKAAGKSKAKPKAKPKAPAAAPRRPMTMPTPAPPALPKAWLEQIRALKRKADEGERAQAELDALRAALGA